MLFFLAFWVVTKNRTITTHHGEQNNITELDCSVTHLALAWLAHHSNTSTIILGASNPAQIVDNLKALHVIPKLTDSVLEKVEAILGNKPPELVSYLCLGVFLRFGGCILDLYTEY